MTTNTRIDLKVPYAEKDQAKVHGGINGTPTIGRGMHPIPRSN